MTLATLVRDAKENARPNETARRVRAGRTTGRSRGVIKDWRLDTSRKSDALQAESVSFPQWRSFARVCPRPLRRVF